MSRPMCLRLVSVVAGAVGFYLPLAAVPMYAESVGTRSAAGLANAALLFATVATELATPRLVTLVGYRWALAAGLFLLGVPALIFLTPVGTTVIGMAAVNAVRGIGFAISVVAGGALTAALIPAERRGEGLALVGLVGGVPALLSLPLGTWAATNWGFAPVFFLTALVPLVAIATVPGLPSREPVGDGGAHGVLGGLRNPALVRPATVFAASASAAGVVVTFVPLAVGNHAAWVAPTALLLQPTTSTAARWVAGRLGDRHGQIPLLVPGVALSILGTVAMSATVFDVLVVLGAAVFGTGFGLLQNATLSLMYAGVTEHDYGTVSALWNGAYDLGMGIGALAVGALVTSTGFSAAFLLVAASMLPALALARREARPTARPTIPIDVVDVPLAV